MGYSPWGRKESDTAERLTLHGSAGKKSACKLEIWVRSLGWEDSLEKGKATHSSILVWEIPGTEGTGRLQSMGRKRIGHDLALKNNDSKYKVAF